MNAAVDAVRSWVTAQKVVVLIVVAAVVAALLVILWEPEGGDPEPGDVAVGLVSGESIETDFVGKLPFGEIEVRTEVGDEAYIDDESRSTKGDTRWVEVSWTMRQQAGFLSNRVWPGATGAQRKEPASRLTLVAGGTRYRLADHVRSSDDGGSTMILVADATDLHLVLSSDDVDRRAVVETRRTSARDTTARRCSDDPENGAVEARVSCELQVTREAYIAGLGWAPRGKDWLLVTASASSSTSAWSADQAVAEWEPPEDNPDRDSVGYLVSGKPTLTLAVDGATKPARTHGKPDVDGAQVELEARAYLIPAGEPATVTMTYRAQGTPEPSEPRPPEAPKRATVEVRQVHRIAAT